MSRRDNITIFATGLLRKKISIYTQNCTIQPLVVFFMEVGCSAPQFVIGFLEIGDHLDLWERCHLPLQQLLLIVHSLREERELL